MIEYVNLAAIVWLTFYIIYSACLVNNNVGRKIVRLNMMPFTLAIASLGTLAVAVIKELLL